MKTSVLVVILLVLAACGGNDSGGGPAAVPCPALVEVGTLVYPADGSSGILDLQHVVVVAGGLGAVTLTLTPNTGLPIISSTIVAVPTPLPAPATVTQVQPVVAFRIPALALGVTYSVTAEGSGPCRALSTFGTFTTSSPTGPSPL